MKDLSSFFVEIKEDFLPEPLVVTILLDSRTSQRTFHLSIERDPKMTAEEARLTQLLFGEKNFQWLASFLGLLTKVSFTRRLPLKNDQVLTAYRLKLLTILANVLTSHLVAVDAEAT